MELIDPETDKLLQDFFKLKEDWDVDLISILSDSQAARDAFLNQVLESLETENMKLSELIF